MRVSLLLLSLVTPPALAGDWAIVGAGNATCAHWNGGGKELQTEVLSWMAGFASSTNIGRAAREQPEYRLEYLTYDYLHGEIRATCGDPRNGTKAMVSILLDVLETLPTHQK